MSAPSVRAKVQYVKFFLSEQLATTDEMSEQAFYIDFKLLKEVWREPSGCLPAARFRERCEDRGYDDATMARVWRELTRNGRWELSEDKKTITSPWLEAGIAASAKLIAAGKTGGDASAASRSAGGPKPKRNGAGNRPKKGTRTTAERSSNGRSAGAETSAQSSASDATHDTPNACSDNEMHDRSTTVQPYDSGCTSSLPSVEKEVQPPAAPASAASHAGGAAVAVAARKPVKAVMGDGYFLRSRAEVELESIAVPATWSAAAPIAELLQLLATAAPEVDVERSLFRPCAAWQRKGGPDGHAPLLAEISACLSGDDGRAGLFPSMAHVPRALALALHGALVMPAQLEPLVLRALAKACAFTIGDEEPDPLRVACWLAGEFARGSRSSQGSWLACDDMRAPERLNGYATAGAR